MPVCLLLWYTLIESIIVVHQNLIGLFPNHHIRLGQAQLLPELMAFTSWVLSIRLKENQNEEKERKNKNSSDQMSYM
jgi:hypothetical protein